MEEIKKDEEILINEAEIDENLRNTIADNLTYYRKQNQMTQIQLAEKINYTDKAVSKWERGDGVPDIYVLNKLALLYHCSISDLVYPRKTKKNVPFFKNRVVISLLSIGLVWFVAIIAFVILAIIINNSQITLTSWHIWYLFIYAIPASCIVALVFSKIWGKRWHRFFEITGIVFGVGLVVYLQLHACNVKMDWIFWMICAAMEVLVILWYCLRRKKKDLQ